MIKKEDSYQIQWEKNSLSFYLTEEAMSQMEKMCISNRKQFVLKLSRSIRTEKYMDGYIDYNEDKYRAYITQINMRRLLNPGENQVSFEHVNVEPLNAQELEYEKQNKALLLSTRNEEKGKKPPSRNSSNKKSALPTELLPEEENDHSSHPYLSCGTFCNFVLIIDPPVIPLPEHRLSKCNMKPSDLIPMRKPVKKIMSGTERYKLLVKSMVEWLLKEYLSKSNVLVNNNNENEQGVHVNNKRKQFLSELKQNGQYFALKEEMKKTVIQIVREEFSKVMMEPMNLESICNDLYVYLLEHLHSVLNNMYQSSSNNGSNNKNEIMNSGEGLLEEEENILEKWKRIADEWECEWNYELSVQCHKQRIAQALEQYVNDNHNNNNTRENDGMDIMIDSNSVHENNWIKTMAQFYYEYGILCLRINDWNSAEEILRESIALHMSHWPSLLAYGVLLCTREQYKEAEVFLQSCVDLEPRNYVSWAVLSLYYELTKQMQLAHEAQLFADQMFYLKEEGHYSDTMINNRDNDKYSFQWSVIQYLLDELTADELAEKWLIQRRSHLETLIENNNNNNNMSNNHHKLLVAYAKLHNIRREYERVEQCLKEALDIQYRSEECWTMLGNLYLYQKRFSDAEKAYETAISIKAPHSEVGTAKEKKELSILYMRLGKTYLSLSKYEYARDVYLKACNYWSCCISWLGVGISYLRCNDTENAEHALNEANIYNNKNGEVWAYLSILCELKNRKEEAEKAKKEAIRCGFHPKEMENKQ